MSTETIITREIDTGWIEGWDDIDRIIAYIEANTDQEELSRGRVISAFDW